MSPLVAYSSNVRVTHKVTMFSSRKCVLVGLQFLTIILSNCNSMRSQSNAGDNTKDNTMGYAEEYCLLETFRPQCLKNEVIVIESAIYGRRYLSRCLESEELDFASNPGYLGCSADVVDYVNTVCSGKKQCEIRIPDANLQHTKPCPKGLDMFLEIRYACVEVVEEDRSCVVSLTSSPLHIARTGSSVPTQSNTGLHCGTRTQPWLLEAPSGQRINISLLDFTPSSAARALSLTSSLKQREPTRASSLSSSSSSRDAGCVGDQQTSERYGYIIDKSAAVSSKRNVSICASRGPQRLSNVYLSSSNVVELVLDHASDMNTIAFLVRIEAIGCSDLVPPEDAWLKRTDNEAIIGCYTSRQTWHLKCEDRRWIGVVSNCTKPDPVLGTSDIRREPNEILKTGNHQVLMLVAVCFLGIAMCLTIICCGVYCLRRYSFPDKLEFPNNSTKYNHVGTAGVRQSILPAEVSGTDHRSRTLDSNNGAISTGWKTPGPTPQYYVLEQTNGIVA